MFVSTTSFPDFDEPNKRGGSPASHMNHTCIMSDTGAENLPWKEHHVLYCRVWFHALQSESKVGNVSLTYGGRALPFLTVRSDLNFQPINLQKSVGGTKSITKPRIKSLPYN